MVKINLAINRDKPRVIGDSNCGAILGYGWSVVVDMGNRTCTWHGRVNRARARYYLPPGWDFVFPRHGHRIRKL